MASRFILPFADVGNGITPSDGAKLFFSPTGVDFSVTPKNTYSDQAATTPNTNPVIANGDGLFSDIWLTGSYKVVLKDKNDVQTWESDPVIETLDVSNSATVFNTVSDMVASNSLSVGDNVRTIGYVTINDGGGNNYQIVAAATGTDDGGSFIDLATHQAKGLFPDRFYSIRQFGAIDDGSTDNTTIINNTVAFVSSLGGGTVWFPDAATAYRITSPINMAIKINLFGYGHASRILADNCDAISFGTITINFGKMTIDNLFLDGVNGTTRTAIIHDGTDSSADELFGLTISRNLITNFNQGIDLRTVRDFDIFDNWIQDVNVAIQLEGKNLSGFIHDNRFVKAAGNGSGTTVGIKTQFFNYATGGLVRPEGINIISNVINGFENDIDLEAAVAVNITANDMDGTVIPIKFGTVDGNLTIKDNHIICNGANTTQGILGEASATVITGTNISIRDNHIQAVTSVNCNGIQLAATSFGNRAYIDIEGNSIQGMDTFDIAIFNSGDVNIYKNKCFSENTTSVFIENGLAQRVITVDQNFLTGNIRQSTADSLSQIIVGTNSGTFSTYVRGVTVITAPATTALVTYASLMHTDSDSGTTTATTANKLVEAGQNFTSTIAVNDVVTNTTDNSLAFVTAVDSDTQLSLSADIMTSGETYTIRTPRIPRFDTPAATGFSSRLFIGSSTDATVKQVTGQARSDGLGIRLNLEVTTAGTVTIPWEVKLIPDYV